MTVLSHCASHGALFRVTLDLILRPFLEVDEETCTVPAAPTSTRKRSDVKLDSAEVESGLGQDAELNLHPPCSDSPSLFSGKMS